MINHKQLGYGLIVFSLILLTVLVFIKVDLDERDFFLCESFHENPDKDMSTCPAHQSNTSWWITIAFGVAVVMLGSGIYLVFLPMKKEIGDTNTVDTTKLDDEEKKIYALLKEHDGSMYQSDLIKETEFSKVRVTRVLDRLVAKNVVDRKRRGMTNIVVLK